MVSHETETQLLIQVLLDANVPKFLSEDVPVFHSLLSDLFPGADLISSSSQVLSVSCSLCLTLLLSPSLSVSVFLSLPVSLSLFLSVFLTMSVSLCVFLSLSLLSLPLPRGSCNI